MPRYIDREQRRRDILHATFQILGEVGMSGLSFRAIADRLGGSTTMVTHYFSSQSALLDELALSLLDDWETQLADLDTSAASDVDRLWFLINWLVPKSTTAVEEERTRITLLHEGHLGADTHGLFSTWDATMRKFIRERLSGLIPAELLELRVDMLRIVTNGLTLSILEQPDSWSTARIEAVLACALSDMGLGVPSSQQPATTPRSTDG